MPKQLNNGQVTAALQRAFGFKGKYIPMLDEVIVPVYNIQDPAPAVVTRLCAGVVFVSTENAGFALGQLFNPVGSGNMIQISHATVISVFEKLTLSVRFSDQEFTSATDPAFRDRRNTGLLPVGVTVPDKTKPVGRLNVSALEGGTRGVGVAVLQVDGALSQTAAWETSESDPRQPLAILGPGQGAIVQLVVTSTGITNEGYFVNWRWLEIPITETNPTGGLPG